MSFEVLDNFPKFNYFLFVKQERFDVVSSWIIDFFDNLKIGIDLQKAPAKLVTEIEALIDTSGKIKTLEADEIAKNLVNSRVIIYCNDEIRKFVGERSSDYPAIWGITANNFIGITKVRKEIVWHELYHKIGLDEHFKAECIMNPLAVDTLTLCDECHEILNEKYLPVWYEKRKRIESNLVD